LRDLIEDVSIARTPGSLGALSSRVQRIKLGEGADMDPQVWSVALGDVVLATVRAAAYDLVAEEDTRNTFLAPLHGRVEVALSETTLSFGDGAGAGLIRPGIRRTRMRPEPGSHFLGIGVSVPRIRQPVQPRRERPGGVFHGETDTPAAGALRHYLTYLVGQFARADSPLLRPSFRNAAEAQILDLMFELDGFDATLQPGEAVAAEQRVTEAEAFMRAHADEAMTIQQIARVAGVGPRALQLAFRRLRGTSPRAMLEHIRLERARSRLSSLDPAMSVTEVALLSGFAHLGRFAAAYRARFKENPSDTRQRSRS